MPGHLPAILEDDPGVGGNIRLRSLGGTFETTSFPNPSGSLTVNATDGDTVQIAFHVIDASFRAWRRGARQAALVVGGGITFFILAAGIHTPLVDAGLVATPPMISVAFLAILLALGSPELEVLAVTAVAGNVDRHAVRAVAPDEAQVDVGGVDRFTIPATSYSELDGQFQFETALHLFEVGQRQRTTGEHLVHPIADKLVPGFFRVVGIDLEPTQLGPCR